jgi:hypothetical protein
MSQAQGDRKLSLLFIGTIGQGQFREAQKRLSNEGEGAKKEVVINLQNSFVFPKNLLRVLLTQVKDYGCRILQESTGNSRK